MPSILTIAVIPAVRRRVSIEKEIVLAGGWSMTKDPCCSLIGGKLVT